MTFEVSGKAEKTWKNYYSCCDVVMVVVDVSNEDSLVKVKEKLAEIDLCIKKDARIFIALNKVDKLAAHQFNDTETTKEISEVPNYPVYLQSIISRLKLSSLNH
jgi:GTPase SAR1 family protein